MTGLRFGWFKTKNECFDVRNNIGMITWSVEQGLWLKPYFNSCLSMAGILLEKDCIHE